MWLKKSPPLSTGLSTTLVTSIAHSLFMTCILHIFTLVTPLTRLSASVLLLRLQQNTPTKRFKDTYSLVYKKTHIRLTMEANWGSKVGLIVDSTLVTVYERNRCKANGLSYASQDKTIEKNMSRLREGLQNLEAELSQAEQTASLPSKELANREDILIKLQQQLEKLEALLQDKDDANARAVLLGLNQNSTKHTRSKVVRFSEHEVEVDNLDNGQMLQLHQRIMDDQDQNLDRLSQSLNRQQELGLIIGGELDTHMDLLEDTDHLVGRTESHLGIARRQLAKVAKGTKGCESWMIILVLVVILIIVIKI
ncbi:hypothetical protein BX616_006120 [Lobosporangium transversale]|uniref:t-SNARE coiled-coil homology domain-containing protein n=1 Tax=Lobosporangium transversale TaxID=64571 RepID=A0A1Y2G7K6_9FUNG|nr:hypothetical protein BCR41DRAFT_363637 [Lobosporangium transversale]KAF9918746.1 hypothetical protein BX616_006120 [Lobosporangium transversale]ORZ00051.1 hypothetical protein BCR41DRAFT_363637 [Lobosporangium transversale]|eukprot:XP_021876092.1 hypothetical protein BCR41DRAFT_363637 [Lobosporangium transversale]